MFAWGAGEYGKLGLGDEEKHTSPVLIEELQVAIAGGGLRVAVCGVGLSVARVVLTGAAQGKGVRAVACGGFHSVALSDTGSVYCWGGGDKGQVSASELCSGVDVA